VTKSELKSFLAVVEKDGQLRAQLALATEFEDVVALARRVGFSLSLESFDQLENELTDSDLEQVAGGNENTSTMKYHETSRCCRNMWLF
jgi:predicted ribosomally synthesized peptide with nif11-like leader